MNKEEFVEEVKKLGIELTSNQLNQLNEYYKLLKEWNEKINLTRIIEEKDVYLKHFYDSITLCKIENLCQKMSLCDIGTGAGFPGIVLKIVFPTLSITLVDALQKRINFLNLVIKELKLDDIQTFHARCEDFAKINREKYDIVTCRAVANLSTLLNYAIPMVKEKGYFIPMKANCEEEIINAKNLLKKLDCSIETIEEFSLPIENSHRTIIKIVKNCKTSLKYPHK